MGNRKITSEKIIIKSIPDGIYPMLPRGYTAHQRAILKEFEQKCLAGRKIVIK